MEDQSTLDAPPRQVPASLRVRVLFGGLLAAIGWGLLAFGGFMATIFVGNSELATWWRFSGELMTTTGIVDSSYATNSRTDHQQVYRIEFAYEVNGRSLVGTSYSRGSGVDQGSQVPVEYAVDDPASARIVGLHSAPFPAWSALVLIFPLAASILIAISLLKGRKRLHLMRHGRSAWGVLTDRQVTNTSVNNRHVYRLTFTYVDETNTQHTAVARSHRDEFFDEKVARHVLFDPENGLSGILELMPGPPQIELRRWRAASIGELTRVLALPTLALLTLFAARYIEI